MGTYLWGLPFPHLIPATVPPTPPPLPCPCPAVPQRLGPKLGLEPYALHATFQFSGTPGKRHRMREWMLFKDPPEYYDHKVGFVAFEVSGL